MNKAIIEKLKASGFKEYEAKVLSVLMKGYPLSVPEIAKEAKVLRNSIYDILKSFAHKGYCNIIETNTTLKYQIIDPEIIIDKTEKEFVEANRKRVADLKDAFNDLKNSYKSISGDDRIDNVELIRGFNKHRSAKFIEIVHTAKKEILSMNRLRGLVSEEINNFSKKFISNGGIIKSLYKISLDFKVKKGDKVVPATNDDLIRVCELFESFGELVRLTSEEIPNMVIIDREKVFMNIGKGTAQTDLVINDKLYAKNMRDLFENYWDKSAVVSEFQKSSELFF